MTHAPFDLPGALVISLDFELHWGQPEVPLDAAVRDRFLRTRAVIPQLLALFEEYEAAATWATVGRLFARCTQEIEDVRPKRRPAYVDQRLHADDVVVGADEADDPFHYAPSLIQRIKGTPRQEIGTHTFAHYYCLEDGQTVQQFAADLDAACEIARRRGIVLRSIVFPRNQENPAYRSVLIEKGITAYRGNPAGVWSPVPTAQSRAPVRRALRLVDSVLQWSARDGGAWHDVVDSDGLANVRATSFLRPFDGMNGGLDELRFRRIAATLEAAARARRVVHLWWHPHNFAMQPTRNLAFLRRILATFARCRARMGMTSLSMAGAATLARDACAITVPAVRAHE